MQTLELIICLHVGVVIALSCIYMYIIHIHILFGKGHVRIKYFLPLEDECKRREKESVKRKSESKNSFWQRGKEEIDGDKTDATYIFHIRNARLLISLSIQQLKIYATTKNFCKYKNCDNGYHSIVTAFQLPFPHAINKR